jgi:hypothetical protein
MKISLTKKEVEKVLKDKWEADKAELDNSGNAVIEKKDQGNKEAGFKHK